MLRSLATADDGRGDRPHLVHPARHAVRAGRGKALHRVEHEQPRFDRIDVPEHCGEVGFGGEVKPFVQRSDPLCPQSYLGRGLLATHDQCWSGLRADTCRPLLGNVE